MRAGGSVKKGRVVHEGKAKVLFASGYPGRLIQHFKDDATAFNDEKRGKILGKGIINNSISAHIMSKLMEVGVPTHFISRLNMREQLVRRVEIIPLEVVVRNIAAGSICKRLGLKEGEPLPRAIMEYYHKNDELGDPLVSEDCITAFGWASAGEVEEIVALALRINDFLYGLFYGVGLKLVDFKVEFGRIWDDEQSQVVLADEISPDSCRLWDTETDYKMDKDRFRQNLGRVAEGYQEVARRLNVLPESGGRRPRKLA